MEQRYFSVTGPVIRLRRPARRTVCRALGLRTRPGCATPGQAFVFDYVADWYRARPDAERLQAAEEWENRLVLPARLGEDIVRSAARWPLLRRSVRAAVGAAVARRDGVAVSAR